MESSIMEQLGAAKERSLSSPEKHYLLACERGDMATVRDMLKLHGIPEDGESPLNVNCVDPFGRSSLQIAIENDNTEMVQLLLDANVETKDCLLHAIKEENVEAVEIILEHLERIGSFNRENQGVLVNERSTFTPDITPLILAAHMDNYEIIKVLLERGASIDHPHDVHCGCKDCVEKSSQDTLRLSQSRINTYRALASASYICLTTRDPVLKAFELSWELRHLSTIEHQFKLEYLELSQRCQKLAVDLLDQTRSSDELETILNYDSSDQWPTRRHFGQRMELSRLKLAIQFRQKKFVAHPSCQQLLASIWYEGLPGYRTGNIVFQILLVISVSVGFPLLSIAYLVAPKSSLGRFLRKPFIKFLCHVGSYCMFILILILASQRTHHEAIFGALKLSNEGMDEEMARKELRGPPPSLLECMIILWILGLIWVEIKQLWGLGYHTYISNMWNILDFITNTLYVTTITLRVIAYIWVENELKSPETSHLGRTLPRRYWNAWDPTLTSECVFATANIFSSLKVIHMFTINPHLGPLQISLGRMIIDIVKFFFVYSLVIFAFACGLHQLLWYYSWMRSSECQSWSANFPLDKECLQDYKLSCSPKFSSFSNLFVTAETLFWSIFGLVDMDSFRLKEPHRTTEWTGKTMFGTYDVISTVVLLNMLIAMMSNSYQYISNQADVEWKFARSKLWIEYFEETGTIPPPFNIIPSPKTFYHLIRWLGERLLRRHNGAWCRSFRESQRLQRILKNFSQTENKYQLVVRNLVKRYIAHVQHRKQKAEGIVEDEISEVKQEISTFRCELLSILSNAGFNTGLASTTAAERKVHNKRRNGMIERCLMKGFTVDIASRRFARKKSADACRFEDKSDHQNNGKKGRLVRMPLCFTNKLQTTRKRQNSRAGSARRRPIATAVASPRNGQRPLAVCQDESTMDGSSPKGGFHRLRSPRLFRQLAKDSASADLP
uniref:ANK_REP_REGION domain-containing protein n=1 Tax=Trichuris muris TaxID=70415 RepID=A0A5S6QSI2_TRIMR